MLTFLHIVYSKNRMEASAEKKQGRYKKIYKHISFEILGENCYKDVLESRQVGRTLLVCFCAWLTLICLLPNTM